MGPRCKRLGDTFPLFRSNSPITKLIILKYTIQWLLLYSQGCATITTRPSDSHLSKYIRPTEKQNFCLVSIYYYLNCWCKKFRILIAMLCFSGHFSSHISMNYKHIPFYLDVFSTWNHERNDCEIHRVYTCLILFFSYIKLFFFMSMYSIYSEKHLSRGNSNVPQFHYLLILPFLIK